jgi:hypothetical protein
MSVVLFGRAEIRMAEEIPGKVKQIRSGIGPERHCGVSKKVQVHRRSEFLPRAPADRVVDCAVAHWPALHRRPKPDMGIAAEERRPDYREVTI